MGRKKNHLTDSAQREVSFKNSRAIEEKILSAAKGDPVAIEELGSYVQNVLLGDFGTILRITFNGLRVKEHDDFKFQNKSADYYLGRITMLDAIIDCLEQYVLDKDNAHRPIEKPEGVQTFNYSSD